jgi:hypothetical protein
VLVDRPAAIVGGWDAVVLAVALRDYASPQPVQRLPFASASLLKLHRCDLMAVSVAKGGRDVDGAAVGDH